MSAAAEILEDEKGWIMLLEDHFGSGSTLQRNERVKLAASFWNNIGAGMVIGGMAAAFFLEKPPGTWTKNRQTMISATNTVLPCRRGQHRPRQRSALRATLLVCDQ